MRIWHFFGYFLSIFTGLAAEVLKDLGTVYLSPNELLEMNLHMYFSGDFLEFFIESQNSTNSYIYPFYTLEENFFYDFKNSDLQFLSVYSLLENSFVLCVRDLSVYVFNVKLITGECIMLFSRTILTMLKNAKIIQGWIGEIGSFLLVNGMEPNGFYVNEIYFTKSTFDNNFKLIPTWDLRYLINLKMDSKVSRIITFWGSILGKDIIFLCIFIEDRLKIIEDIKDVFLLNTNEPQDLEVLDVFTRFNKLVILQKEVGLLLYSIINFKIAEFQIIPFNNYGELKKFSLTNGELVSLPQFAVLTDLGILLIDSETFNIRDFIPFNVNQNTNCQILEPYLFVFDEYQSLVNIFRLTESRVYSLFKLKFENDQRKMMALQDFNGFMLITQNNTKIQFFQLSIIEKTLILCSEINSYVTILAKDSNSIINSTLFIRILEDLYKVHFIHDFRKTEALIVNNYQFYSEIYWDVFDIYSYVSGWNLILNVNNLVTETFMFNYTIKNFYFLKEKTDVAEVYEAGYFFNKFYGINHNGVYENDALIINYKNPLKLAVDGPVIEVLYNDFVLFYEIFTKNSRKKIYPSNCTSVFKFVKKYTFCVDSKKLLILFGDILISQFDLLELTNGQSVLDLTLIFTSLSYPDYVYILTSSQLFGYMYYQNYMQHFKTLDIKANFILSSNRFVYIISSNITVYDKELFKLQKIIPLPDKPTSVQNHFDILYLQISQNTLLINGLNPVVQSLVGFETFGSCKIFPAIYNLIVIYCSNKYYLYESYCEPLCNPLYILNINITNINSIDTGLMTIPNIIQISAKENTCYLNISYNLYLYSFLLEFYAIDSENNNLLVDYDQSLIYSLNNRFFGFNIDYTLYLNGSEVSFADSPVGFNQRVINNNYFESKNYTFIDHDFIRNTEIVLVLCTNSIVFFNISLEKNLGFTNLLHIISEIPQNMYFEGNVECFSINYISTKGELSLFIIYCQNYDEDYFYYNGKVTGINKVSNYLLLLEININSLDITSILKLGISHYISRLQVITSNSNCFSVVCTDNRNSVFSSLLTNNNIYVYKGSWLKDLYINFELIINQETFQVPSVMISCIDGIFISNSKCIGSLYLYITDKLYGLRILKIDGQEISNLQEIEIQNDRLISVGVCGNSVFVLSELTFIYQYNLDKLRNLVHYITFPPSYEQMLIGISSVISCSNYYKPRYLAVNFYSLHKSSFELRLIDLETNLLCYYVKNLDFPGNLTSFSVRKSLFINENIVTAIGRNTTNFFTYYLSDNELVLKKMDKSGYNEMVQKWGSNKFEIVLGYKNEFNQKNTSKFYIQRIGPASNKSHGDEVDFFFLWVILGVSFIILTIISFIVYKKIFRKKKQESVELVDIITPIETKNRGRMFALSLVNEDHPITNSSIQ